MFVHDLNLKMILMYVIFIRFYYEVDLFLSVESLLLWEFDHWIVCRDFYEIFREFDWSENSGIELLSW